MAEMTFDATLSSGLHMEKTVSGDNPLPVTIVAGGGSSGGLASDASVTNVVNAIKATLNVDETIWYDTTNTSLIYIRKDIINEGTGATTIQWTLPDGTSATPTVTNLVPVEIDKPGQSVTVTNGFALESSGNLASTATNTAAIAIATGTPTDSAYVSGTGTFISLLKGLISKITGSQGTVAPGATPTNMSVIGAVYNSTAPTLTNGQSAALQLDSGGSIYANIRAQLPAIKGSTGYDRSANSPSIPVVGGPFSSGIYSGYALIATIAANSNRFNIEVNNNSGSQIVIVRDDGTAANGNAPVNASAFPLAAGSGVGSQGGAWSSTTFKGRLQIYSSISSPQISIYED